MISARAEWMVRVCKACASKALDHIPEKSGRPGVTWRAQIDPPPPALRLAVVAGDILHSLRSALEHLAWALVLENGGEPSDSKPATQFPISLGAAHEGGPTSYAHHPS